MSCNDDLENITRPVMLAPVVKNTFLHCEYFESQKPRSLSAPPRIDIHIAWTVEQPSRVANCTAKASVNVSSEGQAFREFAKLKLQELWEHIVLKLCSARQSRVLAVVRSIAEAKRTRPRCRQRLVNAAFEAMRRHVFSEEREVQALVRYGVIRVCGDAIEFWSADAPLAHPMMKQILCEANRFRAMWEACVFQVVWRAKNQVYTFDWNENWTVCTLRHALERLGVSLAGKALVYGNRKLQGGFLLAHGVGVASIIALARDGADLMG